MPPPLRGQASPSCPETQSVPDAGVFLRTACVAFDAPRRVDLLPKFLASTLERNAQSCSSAYDDVKPAARACRSLERLANARFPDQLDGVGWSFGTDLTYLKTLIAYWRDKYDRRTQERGLNQFPQFTTNIDGLDVHFVHRRSPEPNALPILLVHGWPGTFFEFSIEPLANPKSIAPGATATATPRASSRRTSC